MPFKSQAQRRYMHANHPGVAKRWEGHTPKGKKLPKHVKKKASAMPDLVTLLAVLAAEKRAADDAADCCAGAQQDEAPPQTMPAPTAPHYGPATQPGTSCASCKSFDPASHHCEKYAFTAEPQYTCDGFTPMQIGTEKLADAGMAPAGANTGLGRNLRTSAASILKTPVAPQQGAGPQQGAQGTQGNNQQPLQTQNNPGWKVGVSPSADLAKEVGGQAGQMALGRSKIAARHVLGDPYPEGWNGGFKHMTGDKHGAEAWDSMNGFNKSYTHKPGEFMRKGSEKKADDMAGMAGMQGAQPPAVPPDMAAAMQPPDMSAAMPPMPAAPPPAAAGAGGVNPLTQGFPGGGSEPPQPPQGDAITQGMGAMTGSFEGGMDTPEGNMNMPPGGADNVPKMASLSERVAWVRQKMANWPGTGAPAAPGTQAPRPMPAPSKPGFNPAGMVPGAQQPVVPPGAPAPKSKGTYMPTTEKKAEPGHAPGLFAGAGLGALLGTGLAPPGRRGEGAAHGALRGGGLMAGMGLGATGGLHLGEAIGRAAGSPGGGALAGGLAGIFGGGYGGYRLGRHVAGGPFPGSYEEQVKGKGGRKEEKVEKKEEKIDGKVERKEEKIEKKGSFAARVGQAAAMRRG